MADMSAVLPPADQKRVARALEDDAQVMTNMQLEQQITTRPQDIRDEILRINTEAWPTAVQVALLIPILAGLVGLFNSFRMMRLPDPHHRAPPRERPLADARTRSARRSTVSSGPGKHADLQFNVLNPRPEETSL
jgi:hypothetical protein